MCTPNLTPLVYPLNSMYRCTEYIYTSFQTPLTYHWIFIFKKMKKICKTLMVDYSSSQAHPTKDVLVCCIHHTFDLHSKQNLHYFSIDPERSREHNKSIQYIRNTSLLPKSFVRGPHLSTFIKSVILYQYNGIPSSACQFILLKLFHWVMGRILFKSQ